MLRQHAMRLKNGETTGAISWSEKRSSASVCNTVKYKGQFCEHMPCVFTVFNQIGSLHKSHIIHITANC